MSPIVRQLAPALLLALTPACVFVAVPFGAQGDLSRSLTAEGAAPLDLKSRNGDLTVLVGAASEVRIDASFHCTGLDATEAQARLDTAHIDAAYDDAGVLVVRAECGGGYRDNDGVGLTVRLPETGPLRLETSNGKIVVADATATLVARTSNGGVDIHNHRGAIDVETSNGAVGLFEVDGPVRAVSSNGRIDLQLAPGATEAFELSTSNGSVDAVVGEAFVGRIETSTSNGDVALHSASGVVLRSDLGPDGGWVQVGEGGATSTIDTSNGDVHVTVGG